MGLIEYYRRIDLIPKNGEAPIHEFFDDPGFLKKVEFSSDGRKITITRICPNGHSKPMEINTADYYFEVIGRSNSPE